jgi:hypothetical protein
VFSATSQREDDKVCNCGAGVCGLRCQDSEDGWIWVVEGDGSDGVEAPEIVFVGVI